MGRGRSGVSGGSSGPAPSTMAPNIPQNAQPLTDAAADKLRQDMDSSYDANTKAAVKMYISNTDFDQDEHSLSQTMNYLLDEGVDLNNTDVNTINNRFGLHLTSNDLASMQYTNNYMDVAAHPIGQSTTLQKGAHDDMLRNFFGIQDYSKMTEAQLQQKMVGQAFRTTAFNSTSYNINKNPFLSSQSGSGVSGGRECIFNMKVGPQTRVLFGAKKQSEIVINKGTDFKVTGVRYSGVTATPRGKGSRPQLIIDLETI